MTILLSRCRFSRRLLRVLPRPSISCTPSWSRCMSSALIRPARVTSLPMFEGSTSTRLLSSSGDPRPVEVPSMGDSISEGTVSSWLKSAGDYVDADEVVVVLETDKVSVDVRSPVAGTMAEQLAEEGDTVNVGAKLFTVYEGQGEKPAETAADSSQETVAAAPETPKAAPAPGAHAAAKTTAAKPTDAKSSAAKPNNPVLTGSAPSRNERRVPITRMRQRIAERLKDAQNTAASLTTFNEIDMSNLMNLRSKYKDLFAESHDAKLGFMSAFVKASVAGLQDQPAVNASIEGNEMVYHDYCDISVAVATPNGLVVPVLRNCESLSFAGVEKGIAELGRRARDGQLALEDMTGGTFTISNGGVYGSLMGTPILNPPQSAILGMHGIFQRPVAVDGEVVIRPMMYVALTYDHRIIDGREAVIFLRKVKASVEDPQRLLLEL